MIAPAHLSNYTGVLENAEDVWLHPPRFEQYAELELSPFPWVKKPRAQVRQWSWALAVGDQWANPAWGAWQGEIQVRSDYQLRGTAAITTRLGHLRCTRISAVSRSPLGQHRADYWFNDAYGFVVLDYRLLGGRRLRMELLSAARVTNYQQLLGSSLGNSH